MKTPRDILLEQNQHHDSRLEDIQRDAIKNSVAAEVTRLKLLQHERQQNPEPRHLGCYENLVENIWKHVFLPARRIWLGYAFIWLAIAAFYIVTADHTPTQIASTSATSEAIANWKAQQTILAELTKQPEHEPIDRPKPRVLSPRSEATHTAMG